MIFCGAPFDEVNCAVLRVRRESRSRNLSVVLARGIHLFPFRTEQLSPSAPMVLGPHGPGRVGRRRFFRTRAAPAQGAALVVSPVKSLGRRALAPRGKRAEARLGAGLDSPGPAGPCAAQRAAVRMRARGSRRVRTSGPPKAGVSRLEA